MIRKTSRNTVRVRVHRRLRRKVKGTAERPRLCVFRSLKQIYAQVVDDDQGRTLVAAASGVEGGKASGGNLAGAKTVGRLIAERAKAKGISKVVFDRGGYMYHGRVKALADAAREGGLNF